MHPLTKILLLILLCAGCAPVAFADAGNTDLIVLGEGGFSGGSSPSTNQYYTTGVNTYSVTGTLAYWFSDAWEAGFGAGFGRVEYQSCSGNGTCGSESHASQNFKLFGRYNFAADYGGEYSFSGLELTYIKAGGVLGNVSVLRPFAGYRFPLQDGLALELSVGAGVPVADNTANFSTNYDVQLGLDISL
ncbi:MAG: hypothetical protein ACRER7_01660 [Gammaproteobacteria bacterium]